MPIPTYVQQITKAILGFSATVHPVRSFYLNHDNPLPTSIVCNLNILALSTLLNSHPNRYLVNYVLDGLCYGFDIGFRGTCLGTKPKNLLSAVKNKIQLSEAIDKELMRDIRQVHLLLHRLIHCIVRLLVQLLRKMDRVGSLWIYLNLGDLLLMSPL